jgi:hypothetical protein
MPLMRGRDCLVGKHSLKRQIDPHCEKLPCIPLRVIFLRSPASRARGSLSPPELLAGQSRRLRARAARIAWVTFCVLFVGLDLICLLIVEHASDTSQAMAADESISDRAPHMAKLDLAMDETVRRQACELADTFDALAQLEDTASLAPRDAGSAVARRTQHTGAVIIRDPRLARARTLGDQSGGAEGAGARISATPRDRRDFQGNGSPSADISHH